MNTPRMSNHSTATLTKDDLSKIHLSVGNTYIYINEFYQYVILIFSWRISRPTQPKFVGIKNSLLEISSYFSAHFCAINIKCKVL